MLKHDPIIIDTQDLCKNYNGVQALKNLNLQVRKNSIYGFLGPNGAGKTTTIKLLLGLIKPTSGSGTVLNYNVTRENMKIRARTGYLPQEPRFYEYMSAREVLRFTARFFFYGPKIEIENRVSEMLALVGIEKKADRPIKGFSGGERQRLGIAQAMIHYPDLLILDEPTASLDPVGRHMILELMEKLREFSTIFYSTHILDDVQRVSDTVGILNRGTLVAKGNIEKLLAGSEGTIYLVTLKGDTEGAYKSVSNQPWVSNVNVERKDNKVKWQIKVTDDDLAEENLLRLILEDNKVKVTDYRLKQYELEEIFLQVLEEDENVVK
ncbi:MAG: ABC transporter ATP-binding protein [Candidatus Thorarchaeota archaeon]